MKIILLKYAIMNEYGKISTLLLTDISKTNFIFSVFDVINYHILQAFDNRQNLRRMRDVLSSCRRT